MRTLTDTEFSTHAQKSTLVTTVTYLHLQQHPIKLGVAGGVGFASRSWNPAAEQKYTITEFETPGVVWAVKLFHPYICTRSLLYRFYGQCSLYITAHCQESIFQACSMGHVNSGARPGHSSPLREEQPSSVQKPYCHFASSVSVCHSRWIRSQQHYDNK